MSFNSGDPANQHREANAGMNPKLRLPLSSKPMSSAPNQNIPLNRPLEKPVQRPVLHTSSRPTSGSGRPNDPTPIHQRVPTHPTSTYQPMQNTQSTSVPPSAQPAAGLNLARRRPSGTPAPAVSAMAAGIVSAPPPMSAALPGSSPTPLKNPVNTSATSLYSSSSASTGGNPLNSAPLTSAAGIPAAKPAGARLLARLERLERVGTQLAREEREEQIRNERNSGSSGFFISPDSPAPSLYRPSGPLSQPPNSLNNWCETSTDVTAIVQRRSDALAKSASAQGDAAAASLAEIESFARKPSLGQDLLKYPSRQVRPPQSQSSSTSTIAAASTSSGNPSAVYGNRDMPREYGSVAATGGGGGGGGGSDELSQDEDSLGAVFPRGPPNAAAARSKASLGANIGMGTGSNGMGAGLNGKGQRRGEEYFGPVRSSVGNMGVIAAASMLGNNTPSSGKTVFSGESSFRDSTGSHLNPDQNSMDVLSILGVSDDNFDKSLHADNASLRDLVAAALTDNTTAPAKKTVSTLTRHVPFSTTANTTSPHNDDNISGKSSDGITRDIGERPLSGVRRVPSAGRRAGMSTGNTSSSGIGNNNSGSSSGTSKQAFIQRPTPGTGSGLADIDYFSLLSGAPSAQSVTHSAAHSATQSYGASSDDLDSSSVLRRKPHPYASPSQAPPPPSSYTHALTNSSHTKDPSPPPHSAASSSSAYDTLSGDLAASMAQRLTTLERLARKQAQQLRETDQAARAAAERDARSRVAVGCLVRQVLEMEAFLSDYGMQWAGYSAEAELGMPALDFPNQGSLATVRARRGDEKQRNNGNTTAVAERSGQGRPNSAYKPQGASSAQDATKATSGTSGSNLRVSPMQADLFSVTPDEVRAWTEHVNSALPSSMAVVGADGVARMGPPPQVDVIVFKNGVSMDGAFLRAGASAWAKAMTDLSDGYLPARLNFKYPEGAALRVVDRWMEECNVSTHGVENVIEDAEGVFTLRASARSNNPLRVVNGDIVRSHNAPTSNGNHLARLGTGGKIKVSVNGQASVNSDAEKDKSSDEQKSEKDKSKAAVSHGPPGFIPFTGVGRILGTGARVAPRDLILAAAAQASGKTAATGIKSVTDTLSIAEAISKQTDALVKQALGLSYKPTESHPIHSLVGDNNPTAKKHLPSTIVSDGNVVHVIKPKEPLIIAGQDNTKTDAAQSKSPPVSLERRPTNVRNSSLLTGEFKPNYGRLQAEGEASGAAKAGADASKSAVTTKSGAGEVMPAMHRQGTTNVAQSRLVHAAAQRSLSRNTTAVTQGGVDGPATSKTNEATNGSVISGKPKSSESGRNPFSATGSMFASVSATVGNVSTERQPSSRKKDASSTGSSSSAAPATAAGLVCVLDASTSAYIALSMTAVTAANRQHVTASAPTTTATASAVTASTAITRPSPLPVSAPTAACYVKVTFTDKPSVTVASPCAAPAAPLYLRIAASAPLSQLWLAVKAHRHRLGYPAGPVEGRAPFQEQKVGESGSVADAGLAGGQLVVRPC